VRQHSLRSASGNRQEQRVAYVRSGLAADYLNSFRWRVSFCGLTRWLGLNALRLLGNFSTGCGEMDGASAISTSMARSLGIIPPNRRDIFKSERLPQTKHWSCGLSLTTSQSAHSTAFCKEMEFKGRSLSRQTLNSEPFIVPRKTQNHCTGSTTSHKRKVPRVGVSLRHSSHRVVRTAT